MDIHPGAQLGRGLLIDDGNVIRETAIGRDNVSILHNVILGVTGKAFGDKNPKIGDGVVTRAGSQILGSIRTGEVAKISAGLFSLP